MLKDRIKQLLTKSIDEQQKKENIKIELYPEEINYIEIHQLIPNELERKITLTEKRSELRFSDAYIERCDKESEEMISKESCDFFKQPIGFLKKKQNEFIYIESGCLDLIGVDALSLEVDDVFGTYDVMLGLKLQKKYDSSLRKLLNNQLSGKEPKFDLMFNREDGLWDFNLTLNYVYGFAEDLSIGEACLLIYSFLFNIVDQVESRGE